MYGYGFYHVGWFSASSCRHEAGWPVESPIGILKRRYARGEIDKQEFEERKKDPL